MEECNFFLFFNCPCQSLSGINKPLILEIWKNTNHHFLDIPWIMVVICGIIQNELSSEQYSILHVSQGACTFTLPELSPIYVREVGVYFGASSWILAWVEYVCCCNSIVQLASSVCKYYGELCFGHNGFVYDDYSTCSVNNYTSAQYDQYWTTTTIARHMASCEMPLIPGCRIYPWTLVHLALAWVGLSHNITLNLCASNIGIYMTSHNSKLEHNDKQKAHIISYILYFRLMWCVTILVLVWSH